DGAQQKFGLRLYLLDTDHWKSWVYERLGYPDDAPGAWFLHQDASEDYCKQIVSEVRVIGPSGRTKWVPRSRHNHFLDCEAMAAAAAHLLNVQKLRDGIKDPGAPVNAYADVAKRVNKLPKRDTADPTDEQPSTLEPLPAPPDEHRVSRFARLARGLNG
ncbi:MAG TPA: terminase gpA endonuclease subunit, partial [Pseudorhodoferax sp.]|nr:terminase gpA endonuclease subunit [Pseudorhodoferax sp.]